MTDLLIRADLKAHVLRSTGGQPNGIVCVIAPDDEASWAIDSSYEPGKVDALPKGGVIVESRASESGAGPASTAVDADTLVAACESPLEARGLLEMAVANIGFTARKFAPLLNFEIVRSHVDLAIATRDALARHGYLAQPGATS